MKGHSKRLCMTTSELQLENGIYAGSMYDGRPSGHGCLRTNSATYTGYFLEGQKHGTGTEVRVSGKTYSGEWQNDLYHGAGRLVYAERRIQEGTFYHGRLHGHGKMISNTSTYIGEFHHGVYHGHGLLTTHAGIYKGQFLYGIQHGRGSFTWTNGDIYSGKWKRGMRDGTGIISDATSTYTGNWKRDMKHGWGRHVCTHMGTYEGHWKRDQRHTKGTQTYINGVQYIGGWCQGKKTGYGTQTWPNGDKYEGFWSSDQFYGRGTLSLTDAVYTGEWSEGKRTGLFVEHRTDGSRWSGPWVNDVRHGIFSNQENKRRMYVRGTRIAFDHVYEAKESVKRALKQHEYEYALVVAEYYPSIVSWTFLFKYDLDGRLIKMATREQVYLWVHKHLWALYRNDRYEFIEKLVALVDHEKLQRASEFVPELFDQITHDFVANPWIVRHVSYSEKTKIKLLRGLHLGEFGRCPPKDPFTRQTLTEDSGTYLREKPQSESRKLYFTLMKAVQNTPTIREMAYSFDLEDFEQSLKNARAAKDTETIRRLMKERELFIQQNH